MLIFVKNFKAEVSKNNFSGVPYGRNLEVRIKDKPHNQYKENNTQFSERELLDMYFDSPYHIANPMPSISYSESSWHKKSAKFKKEHNSQPTREIIKN